MALERGESGDLDDFGVSLPCQNLLMNVDELIEAWRVNNALNLELLGVCSDEDLDLKPGKGKTIRSNFAHLVLVRRSWLEDKLPAEAAKIEKPDWKTATREQLEAGLNLSADLMSERFRKMAEARKPGKWSLPLFFAYCVAHEAHHRSQIEIALRVNGREPDDAFLYGLWDWAKK